MTVDSRAAPEIQALPHQVIHFHHSHFLLSRTKSSSFIQETERNHGIKAWQGVSDPPGGPGSVPGRPNSSSSGSRSSPKSGSGGSSEKRGERNSSVSRRKAGTHVASRSGHPTLFSSPGVSCSSRLPHTSLHVAVVVSLFLSPLLQELMKEWTDADARAFEEHLVVDRYIHPIHFSLLFMSLFAGGMRYFGLDRSGDRLRLDGSMIFSGMLLAAIPGILDLVENYYHGLLLPDIREAEVCEGIHDEIVTIAGSVALFKWIMLAFNSLLIFPVHFLIWCRRGEKRAQEDIKRQRSRKALKAD